MNECFNGGYGAGSGYICCSAEVGVTEMFSFDVASGAMQVHVDNDRC